MVLFLLSLIGIPPLAGFVGKFLLFGAAIDAHFTWLAVVAIFNSVLSLAVYLRIVVPMYRQHSDTAAPIPALEPMPLVKLVWAIAFVFTLGIGLATQVLLARLT
jgi:NADH-quinone oxidoreductase subunit N